MNEVNVFFRERLDAAIAWLVRSQQEDGGFSAAYSYFRGWDRSYPETTGYILETLIRYSSIDSSRDWQGIVQKAGEWLLSLQFPEGGFPGGYGAKDEPRVFNTGMILFGLSSLFTLTKDIRYRSAGSSAVAWLARIQNQDGSWSTHSLGGVPHVYHSRVAWGIYEIAHALDMVDKVLPMIQRANDWVLTQQEPGGWFRCNDLLRGLPPLTHNIAYTIRGLLECGVRLERKDWLSSAILAAQAVRQDWAAHGKLPAGYGSAWIRGPEFRCLTGDAQMGIIWYRLWQITGDAAWLSASRGIAEQVARTQSVHASLPGIRGGIPGAWPIWERYLRFRFPNWAVKFFSDLVMDLLEI